MTAILEESLYFNPYTLTLLNSLSATKLLCIKMFPWTAPIWLNKIFLHQRTHTRQVVAAVNNLDLYLEGTQFESPPGYWLSW